MGKSRLSKREKAIHEQFSQYGKNAKEWMRKCALMLPQIEREWIWKKLGFSSIHHYSAVVGGMSLHQSREALRVVKKIEDKPALMRVAEKKGINAVSPVATIATKETAKLWAKRATEMSVGGLKTYIHETRKTQNVLTFQPANETETVQVDLPPDLARRLDRVKKRDDFESLLAHFLDEVEENEAADKPDAVESESHYIPAKIRTYSTKRTGKECSFYGCDKAIYQLHHADRFALIKTHDPDRLASLCREHNELVHLGLVEEDGPPEAWKIRENADTNSPKFRIDQKVQSFRYRAESG